MRLLYIERDDDVRTTIAKLMRAKLPGAEVIAIKDPDAAKPVYDDPLKPIDVTVTGWNSSDPGYLARLPQEAADPIITLANWVYENRKTPGREHPLVIFAVSVTEKGLKPLLHDNPDVHIFAKPDPRPMISFLVEHYAKLIASATKIKGVRPGNGRTSASPSGLDC